MKKIAFSKFKVLEKHYVEASDSVTGLVNKIEETMSDGESVKFEEPISTSYGESVVSIGKRNGVMYAVTEEGEEIDAGDMDWSLIHEITMKLL